MTPLEQALADAAVLRQTLPLMAGHLKAMRDWLTVLTASGVVLAIVAVTLAVAMGGR